MNECVIPILKMYTIEQVQKIFSGAYPFLKMEFFRNGHGRQQHSYKKDMLSHNTKLEDVSRNLPEGDFVISDSMTVEQLEKGLYEKFGLPLQVFRKSGNVWLETTMTDGWTLKQQNDHGKEISGHQPWSAGFRAEDIERPDQ
jgi:hypothetical protein